MPWKKVKKGDLYQPSLTKYLNSETENDLGTVTTGPVVAFSQHSTTMKGLPVTLQKLSSETPQPESDQKVWSTTSLTGSEEKYLMIQARSSGFATLHFQIWGPPYSGVFSGIDRPYGASFDMMINTSLWNAVEYILTGKVENFSIDSGEGKVIVNSLNKPYGMGATKYVLMQVAVKEKGEEMGLNFQLYCPSYPEKNRPYGMNMRVEATVNNLSFTVIQHYYQLI